MGSRKQVIVQLDDRLVEELDALAAELGVSRSELLRRGARGVLELHRLKEQERQYADAYRRVPQDPELTETLSRLASETTGSW